MNTPEFLDVPAWAEYLTARGIPTTVRQAQRQFATDGFPRFAAGRRFYTRPADGLAWLSRRSRSAFSKAHLAEARP